jgi:peptidoglycan-associated lipoprotein
MRLKKLLLFSSLLILTGCSNNSKFISDLNYSFDNWNDEPNDHKVFAEGITGERYLEFKPNLVSKANASYNFILGDYEVQPMYVQDIKNQVHLIKSKGYRVKIVGHSDERGSREYNFSLAWKRAKEVSNYFQQFGLNSDNITVVSYGKEKPLVDGHNPSSWSKNRRVEVFYEEN